MTSFPTSLPASSAEGVLNHGQVYDELYAALVAIGISSARKIGVIASTQYNPGVASSPTTTSATFADIDASNLVITFTAPPSGVVIVDAALNIYNGTAGTAWALNLRDAGGDIAGTAQDSLFAGSSQVSYRCNHSWRVSGLTPGTSYTYKLGFSRTTGGGTVQCTIGGSGGAAVMVVTAA